MKLKELHHEILLEYFLVLLHYILKMVFNLLELPHDQRRLNFVNHSLLEKHSVVHRLHLYGQSLLLALYRTYCVIDMLYFF